MKLGSVTKLVKRKETKSKKIDDDFMSEILTSLHFSSLRPIWSNPEAGFRTHIL